MILITELLEAEQYLGDIQAVVFDLDDTLYSEKEYVRSGYRKIAEHFSLPELESELWQIFEAGGKAIDEALALHGLDAFSQEALHIYRYQSPEIHLYPGAADMMVRLRHSGKRIGILTDGRPEGQRAKLNALSLPSLVDEILITDELGGPSFRKPNPAAFVLMQQRLNVPFEKMAYIGDNPKKDFIAPEALGMHSIYYQNPDGLYSRGV